MYKMTSRLHINIHNISLKFKQETVYHLYTTSTQTYVQKDKDT